MIARVRGGGERVAEAGPDLTVEEFFRPGGLLSRSLPGWEHRPGQFDMASEVLASLEEERHLVVEAGTGTGKTLAYLVPLILSGKRAVVSTGTKNLQDQLIRKDVPLLEEILGGRLRVAVMKGRGNFLCLQKLHEKELQPRLTGTEAFVDLSLIRDWARQTETGDRAELPDLPASSRTWAELDARKEACTGRKCDMFEECFVTRMHQRAREADLVIVNHHLFFADLALRTDDFGPVLPEYQAVVFDEAHEIEGVVGQFFGARLSSFQMDELARDTSSAAKRGRFGSKALDRRVKGLRAASSRFFALFDSEQPRAVFAERTEFRRKHASEYAELVAALGGVRAELGSLRKESDQIDPLRNRAQLLQLTLRVLLDDIEPDTARGVHEHPVLSHIAEDRYGNFVHWLEKRGKGVFLQATPIDVAPILEDALFRDGATAILASATLAVDGGFEYIRGRLGLNAANERTIPGHFDYGSQAMLYLPEGMPDPNSDGFPRRAVDEIIALTELSQGRAFVLFTSHHQMRRIHKEASFSIKYPCLLQGQGSNAALLEKFRTTENCVLFATASFWQGVDVPGDQLSCVIIDKLPFAVPSDPIVQARIDQIRQAGGNPFRDYQIPSAVLSLKQGFGRLIRAGTDRGVLALLDNRVVSKPYGRTFLESLPEYAMTRSLDEVARFLRA